MKMTGKKEQRQEVEEQEAFRKLKKIVDNNPSTSML